MTTTNLVKVQELLGIGWGVTYSWSPYRSIQSMTHPMYCRGTHSSTGPGWIFLTGKYEEIERPRRQLRVYDLDPVIDVDKQSHANIITLGSDRIDRWATLLQPKSIVTAVPRITYQ